MISKTEEKLAASLSAETIELLPFLPYLLKDFWELGSDPEIMCELIQKHVNLSPETKVLDLACGKGAVSIRIAERFQIKVKGVDILPEFIENAKQKASEHEVMDLCEFVIGDINEALENEKDYDVVVFGAVGAVLGSPPDMLRKLKSVIKPSGYVLIDECYLPDNVKQGDVKCNNNYEYLTGKQWALLFKEAELELLDTDFGENNTTLASGDSDIGMAFITARADELIEKHPDKKEIFEGYVRNQQNEYDDIENSLICVTWLLKSHKHLCISNSKYSI
jgi:SAM-dependent methyltransferase